MAGHDNSAELVIASLEKKVEMLQAAAVAAAKEKTLEIQLATAKAESAMKTVALQALERNFSRSGPPLSAGDVSPWATM